MKPLDQWIMEHEGLRLKPYHDTEGFITIGYGHNLSINGITINIADMLLDQDISGAKKDVIRNFPWVIRLNEARQNAMFHLCFWIGIAKLSGFHKMLIAAESEDWQTVRNELLNSQLHNDIPERTEEIARQLLTGE